MAVKFETYPSTKEANEYANSYIQAGWELRNWLVTSSQYGTIYITCLFYKPDPLPDAGPYRSEPK